MEKGLYIAAMNGDTGFLSEAREREIETGYWDEYLVSRTHQNNNIIHIATLHGHTDFIRTVLTLVNFSLFKLISQKNDDGDTPLHIASKEGNMEIVQLLVGYMGEPEYNHGEIKVVQGGDDDDVGSQERPWTLKNSEGNTPLHEAIIHGNFEVATYLVEHDDELVGFVNNRKETPLHLAVTYNAKDEKQMIVKTTEIMNKQHAGSLTYKGRKCPTKEESLSMIKLLVRKNNACVYIHDEGGMTPVLRAATASNVDAIHAIVTEFPDSAEMRDFDGRTILHLVKIQSYQDAKFLMEIPQIVCLKNRQDCFGNTPAFVIVKDIIEQHQSQMSCEFGMLKALLDSSADLTIKNKQGLSVTALIHQHSSDTKKFQPGDEEIKTIISAPSYSTTISEDEIYKFREAILKPDLGYLRGKMNKLGNAFSDYGCPGGGNILHGVLKARNNTNMDDRYNIDDDDDDDKNKNKNALLDFIEEVLDEFPNLLCQGDLEGDTPLHIIVQDHKITQSFFDKIIHSHLEKYKKQQDFYYCPPWKVKNVKGNTIFHEALLLDSSSAKEIALFLEKIGDKSAFTLLNYQNETPLHVLCRHTGELNVYEEFTGKIVNEYTSAAYMRDKDGLTPLLRAAKSGNIKEVQIICEICPGSAKIADNKDRVFWHMFDLRASRKEEIKVIHELLENEEISKLLNKKDNEGKTPLEIAVEEQNYHLLKALKAHQKISKRVTKKVKECDVDTQLLMVVIALVNHCSTKLEQEFLNALKKMRGKSYLGVKESDLNTYISTLGFTAVLLATIAFTAAFTIPGGFRQEHEYLNNNKTSITFEIKPNGELNPNNITSDLIGTPVFLGTNLKPFLVRAAFFVFMVCDIITMCLSTFVIYCLLLMMKSAPLKMLLIDVSILSIQICFYTVMITYMMGVSATTLQVYPLLAYSAVVLCMVAMLNTDRWVYYILHSFHSQLLKGRS